MIKDKLKEYVNEITWRYSNKDYTESDKLQVVIHETIDKDVSFISIADVETLCNDLGYTKISQLEQDYINEFGELPTYTKTEHERLCKQRLLLFFYFEQEIYKIIIRTTKNKIIWSDDHL